METKCNNCGKIGEGMIGGMGACFCDKDCEKEYFADASGQYNHTIKAIFYDHDADFTQLYCIKCGNRLFTDNFQEFIVHKNETGEMDYTIINFVCKNCKSMYRLGD